MDGISVIIPCYNAARYIDRCLTSLTEQTYPTDGMQILCVNDASTDDTLDMLKDWESRHPDLICVIDCVENGHLGAARNIGMDYADGAWIAFIDADDWVEREYLQVLHDAAARSGAQVAACRDRRDPSRELQYFEDSDVFDGREDARTVFDVNDAGTRKKFFREQPLKLYAWGKLIRKSFLEEHGLFFPERLAYEDIVWGNLVNMYVERACLVDRVMYHYYVNPDSIVLKKNETYHVDHLTTQELMWAQLQARGFAAEYRSEMEYEYLYNGYLAMLKILALRYDDPPYSVFRLLQELTRSKVSRVSCERFAADPSIPELHRLLFGMIHGYVSKSGFAELIGILRKSGL